jgi:hypothetical protein
VGIVPLSHDSFFVRRATTKPKIGHATKSLGRSGVGGEWFNLPLTPCKMQA